MIKQKKGENHQHLLPGGCVGFHSSRLLFEQGGVHQLTKVLAIEWAPYNILVNAIAPTFVETPLSKPMFEKPGFREYVIGNILLGRIGQPEDVIGGVIYLASEASNLVTGHILLIDGGWTAR
jgi:2-deoxy-D-gluconate 3-dehydrogenase